MFTHKESFDVQSHIIADIDKFSDSDSRKIIKVNHLNIESIVHSVFKKNRNYSKFPNGIVTFTTKSEELLENDYNLWLMWLITYLETNGFNSDSVANISEFYKYSNTDQGNSQDNSPSGVYLWPKPYLFQNSVLIWVIYALGNTCDELGKFSQMAASVSIPLNMNEFKMKNPDLAILNTKMYNYFQEKMAGMKLVPVKFSSDSDELVTLSTFQSYLQLVADNLNTDLFSMKELKNMDLRREIKQEPLQTDIEQNNEEIVGKMIQMGLQMYYSTDHCNQDQRQCQNLLKSAQSDISKWIDQKMSPGNISQMVIILKSHFLEKLPEQQGILKEVEEMVQILKQYIIQLYNMFDHYICFSGDDGFHRMEYLCGLAENRAKDTLAMKNQIYYHFTSSILNKSCQKLTSFVEAENMNIIQLESILAKEVHKRIIDSLQIKLQETAEKEPPEMIQEVHKNMMKHCIWMMTHSLNYDGKLSNVTLQETNNLQDMMRSVLEKLPKSLPKPIIRNNQMEINQITRAYAQDIQKCFEKFAGMTRLQKIHFNDQLMSKMLQNLPEHSYQDQLKLHMKSYFDHIVETQEQSISIISGQTTQDTAPTLCVYLTPDRIRVFAENKPGGNDYTPLLFGPNNLPDLPPILAMTKSKKFLYGWDAVQEMHHHPNTILKRGGVCQFATNSGDDITTSKFLIGELFKVFKTKAEKELNVKEYGKVMVVVPFWFNLENRGLLRDVCKNNAKFSQSFVISEVSLAAYVILNNLPLDKIYMNFAVVIAIRDEKVQVKFYQRNGLSGINMKAITESKLEGLMNEETRENIINAAYQKAIGEILDVEHQQKACMVICELPEWSESVKSFLKKRQDLINIKSLREDDEMLKGIFEISKFCEEIQYNILDYNVELFTSLNAWDDIIPTIV